MPPLRPPLSPRDNHLRPPLMASLLPCGSWLLPTPCLQPLLPQPAFLRPQRPPLLQPVSLAFPSFQPPLPLFASSRHLPSGRSPDILPPWHLSTLPPGPS